MAKSHQMDFLTLPSVVQCTMLGSHSMARTLYSRLVRGSWLCLDIQVVVCERVEFKQVVQ